MKYNSIAEALHDCENTKELYLHGDECKNINSEDIEKLINLESLCFFPQSTEWESFPEGFKKLNIKSLHVRNIRLNELIGMPVKNLSIQIAHIDILPLCKNFPDLEELSLRLGEDFELPSEIERLQKLKKLSISGGTLKSISKNIAGLTHLKELNLRALNLKKLPMEFTLIPNIERLSLKDSPQLIDFPEEIKNWKKLKNLYFEDVFKNRKKLSWDEEMFNEDKPVELPAALSSLSSLESVEFRFCPIISLLPLGKLTNLRVIKVTQACLEDISAVKNLINLEELELSDSYHVKEIESLSNLINLKSLDISNMKIGDLSPLKKLTKLEYLNINGCTFDNSKMSVQEALLPLYKFENLKQVEAQNFSQEDWENRDISKADKVRLSKEKIHEILENDKSDIGMLETAFNSIGDIENTFGVSRYDADDSTLEIELLDNALNKSLSELKEETLIHLLKVSFSDTGMGDSYNATVLLVEEIIRRKSIKAQNAVVAAFKNCAEYYDTGHRYYGSTVQDQLIDFLFPEFEIKPLAELVLWLNNQFLNNEYGDGMCSLFPALFSKMQKSEYEDRVIEHFSQFIFENCDSENYEYLFTDILKEQISEKSKKAVKDLQKSMHIVRKAFEEKTIETLNKLLEQVGKKVPMKAFAEYNLTNIFECIPINKNSFELLFQVFKQIVNLKEGFSAPQILKLLCMLDLEKTTLLLKQLSETDKEMKKYIISILEDGVSHTEETYINKQEYEELSQKLIYMLEGKSEELIIKETAEEKEVLLLKKKEESDKESLEEAFSDAMMTGDNQEFIQLSQKIVKETQDAAGYSFLMANYSTKLIINSLQQGDFIPAREVVLNYSEVLLPVVGPSIKMEDVASNSLVLAILSKDKEVEDIVFDKLLPKDLKAEDVKNEILAFNLSCYYAINNNKEKLLPIVKQALNMGKSSKQFMTDTDFEKFWKDKDFLEILNS